MTRSRTAALMGVTLLSCVCMLHVGGQEKKKTTRKTADAAESVEKQSETSSRPSSPWRRLPTGYGALELSDEQKEELYSVREGYGAQIDALEEQIEAIRQAMADDCEAVLTSAQKKALAATVDGAAKKTSAKPVSAATTRKSAASTKSARSKSDSSAPKSGSKKKS